MLNSADSRTVFSLRALQRVVTSGRSIVWWVGAGASVWAGYESWKDLARRMRSHFHKLQPGFENSAGQMLITECRYPDFFQLCKDSNGAFYRRFLSEAFKPKSRTPTYNRFISRIREVNPLHVVTTNIDEEIERDIPEPILIQRTDISRAALELQVRRSFIAKLHGSVSAIETVVLAKGDYNCLLNGPGFIQAIKNVFMNGSVVFLGYGVRDEYVLRLLAENAGEQALFGAGPHFVVTSKAQAIPSGLQPIEYRLGRLADHAAAVSVIDVVLQASRELTEKVVELREARSARTESKVETAYYLSDFLPPGTWITSQTAVAGNQSSGKEIEVTIGLGFTNEEIPFRESTAFHDLLVGLICFDLLYLPLASLQSLRATLSEALIGRLLESGALRFIDLADDLAVVFDKGGCIGSLAHMTVRSRVAPRAETAGEKIRRFLKPVPGQEAAAERVFELIEQRVTTYARVEETRIASLTRDALLMPLVPKLLGIGDAISPSQVPRWLTFPYLRLGHLVYTAAICNDLGIQAAKIPFGSQCLTTAAFGSNVSATTADEAASYVLSGRFNTDLGSFVMQDPSVIGRVLEFRSTQAGESLRREIRDALLSDSASEFTASVNVGLSRTIPSEVLQRARDGMSALFTESSRLTSTPAVWANEYESDAVTRFWRDKSRRMLLDLCQSRGISRNDPCPCGSGDKLRDCCLPPLHT